MTWLVVALAGGVGAALRYGMTVLFAWAGRTSIWATFWTNVIGGFLMAIVVCLPGGPTAHPGLAVGLLGGFTTFSAVSLDAATDLRARRWDRGLLLPLGLAAASIAAFFVGLMAYGIADALL